MEILFNLMEFNLKTIRLTNRNKIMTNEFKNKRIKKYQPFLDIDCQKYKTVILETIKVKL